MNTMKYRISAWLMLSAALWPAQAPAQTCSVSMDNVAFGIVDPAAASPVDVLSNMRVNCSGFATPNLRLCLHLMGPGGASLNPRSMLNAATQLNYNIYKDAARTQIWGSSVDGTYGANAYDTPLNAGAASVVVPVYSRLFGAQNSIPPGNYVATFSAPGTDSVIAWIGYTSSPPVCFSQQSGGIQFQVTATVSNSCTVTATNIDFGQAGVDLQSGSRNSTGVISATCTTGANYSLSLNAGQGAGASTAQRRLTRAGGTDTLVYQLYSDSGRTQSWGDGSNGSSTVSASGTGAVQTRTVYATLPAQSLPPAGVYNDTITVTITY